MTSNKFTPENPEEEESIKIDALEQAGNHQDEDETMEIEDSEMHTDRTDYSMFTKEDFVKKANDLIFHPNISEANESYKKMRLLFDEIIKKERERSLQEFVAQGNEPRGFKPSIDPLKNEFYAAYTKFLERRAKEKEQAELEKIKNLKAKKEILEKIRVLTESEEKESSLNELKELQRQWKQIRRIPQEQMQELWETYRFLLDKFYDNLSIFNELKDLDRQKNLESKIELCKKVGELLDEKSIKKSHILLNKYHEDFKNIGPVPKEFSEEIWNTFKTASDNVIEQNKKKIEEMKEQRKQNLDLKTLLCDKIEQIAAVPYTKVKEWNSKGKEIEDIFTEWKNIGPVPESVSDQIWKRFREAQNTFYTNRKEFFGNLSHDKENNYKQKLELIAKAEKSAQSSDLDKGSIELIQLQEKWKAIGPVPEKYSNEIWAKFRAVCDEFFKRRDIQRSAQKEVEKENLSLKEAILAKMQELLNEEDSNGEGVLSKLRDFQREWSKIGFVPSSKFQKIRKAYDEINDSILNKFKLSAEEFKKNRAKEHYEMLSEKSNGKFALQGEERKVQDKMKALQSELITLQNNIEFFANSKNADKLKSQMEEKIEKIKELIHKNEQELRIIRSVKK